MLLVESNWLCYNCHNKFQSRWRPGCSSQPSLRKKNKALRLDLCKRKQRGQEVKAGIGICNIPKPTAYPTSSGDKTTLNDLVWKAPGWINGEQVHEENGFTDIWVYVPLPNGRELICLQNGTFFSVFSLSTMGTTEMSWYCISL